MTDPCSPSWALAVVVDAAFDGGLLPVGRRCLAVVLRGRAVRPSSEPVPDFAAWMEVWLGDRWWTFDPRNNTRRAGRVIIGRNAADVAMATTFGDPVLETMTVHADRV